MVLKFHPNPGTILLCDYRGFSKPEMIKKRPVVVVSPRSRHRELVIVAAISTTAPHIPLEWHCELAFTEPLSPEYPELKVWVKCDMLNTFSLERLDRFHKRVMDKRKYYDRKISEEDLLRIKQGIAAFLSL